MKMLQSRFTQGAFLPACLALAFQLLPTASAEAQDAVSADPKHYQVELEARPAAQDACGETEAIRAVNGAWAGHRSAGDADAIAGLYRDDALFMPPGAAAITGRARIREFVAGTSAVRRLPA